MISYASEDKTTALAICSALEGSDVRCWIAPRDVQPGSEYGEEIVYAISGCRCMVLVYSGAAEASPHVRSEIERAFSMEKPIVSFRVENIEPSPKTALFLSKTHWLDALTPPVALRIAELTLGVVRLLSTANTREAAVQPGASASRPAPFPGPVPPQAIAKMANQFAIKKGVDRIANAVRATMGPKGRGVLLYRKSGATELVRDVRSIVKDIELSDPNENMGASLCKDAATQMLAQFGTHGDVAIVVLQALLDRALPQVEAGTSAVVVTQRIRKAAGCAAGLIKRQSRQIKTKAQVELVAAGAGRDEEVGKCVALAFDSVGKDSVISLVGSQGRETTLEVAEGMQFDGGYISPYFVTDADRSEAVLENALVLIHEKKISSAQEFVPFLEKAAQTRRQVLVIAEDVEEDALATVVLNKIRGVLQIACVKAPGFGDRRKAMIKDIAVLTGGQLIREGMNPKLDNVTMDMLGTAERIVITKEHTTIIKGGGAKEAILARINQIRTDIDKSDSEYDREKMRERLAKLSGGVAVLKVGGSTEIELKEKMQRFGDALNAARAAIDGGIISGTALVPRVGSWRQTDCPDEQSVGIQILEYALCQPLWQVAQNAGFDGDEVVKGVRSSPEGTGWDPTTNVVLADFMAGPIDPTRALLQALELAVGAAELVLGTDTLVAF